MSNGEREIQNINIRRKKVRQSSKALTVLLVFIGFLLGFVIGMLAIYFKSQKEISDINNELTRVIQEQSAIHVTNVYIPERKISEGKVAMNAYNVDNFRIDEGFMAYFNDKGEKISHLGVDLSYHNDNVNWAQLASSGCEFVMLRCGYRGYTEGSLNQDEKFEEYLRAARSVGLDVGVYFFSQATTIEEAEEEAEYVVRLLDGVELQYPVAFDTEYVNDENARTNTVDISDEFRSQLAIAFCEKISEYGYYPMVYASENWLRRNMEAHLLKDYDIWAPQYAEENDFIYDFTIWQYTDSGSIPGIEGEVDLDISMVDYASFVPQVRQAYLTGGEYSKYDSRGKVTITTQKSNPSESDDPDNVSDLEADDSPVIKVQ